MSQNSRIKALFLEAVDKYAPHEWPDFLKNACGDEADLRAGVEKLLKVHMENATAQDPEETQPLSGSSGDVDGSFELSEETGLSSIEHFRLLQVVGRGGMGSVFYALDERLDRHVALKLPRLDVFGNPTLRSRFLREAKVAAGLSHPGLVAVHEFGVSGQLCYLVSEWCPGGDLAAWLRRCPGPLPAQVVARFIQQLASAVAYCHDSGVLHLDIKPGNIILKDSIRTENGSDKEPGSPMLTDFGLARMVEDNLPLPHTSLMLGTPLYMAPEQAACRTEDIGRATDVFSIGVVMYELLTGRRLFEGTNSIEILDQVRSDANISLPRMDSIPRDLRVICQACLERRPEDRYSSARDLADDLTRFLNGDPVQIRPVSRLRKVGYRIRKPERIWQAGLSTVAIQTPMVLLLAFLWLIISMKLVRTVPEGWDSSQIPFLILLLTVHVPSLVIGIFSLNYKWWSVPVGLLFSLNFLVPTVLVVLGIMSPMQLYDGNPMAAFLMHYSFAVFAAFQTFAYAAAVPAAMKLRKQLR
ncbi:MAG: serine/threonine protein kinase [Planctomycetaceae bacterium]|nr:serine/threonine protein kinase [Planctomycetaceae bacterium]